MPVRTEEIIERIRREIAEEAEAKTTDRARLADVDSLPAISGRPELEYLNRNWQLFDPLSEMRSHRRFVGRLVVRFRWVVRRLVLGVLDRYFEKERYFLLELVRFNNAVAERSDRLLRELTERTKAVAERNDLFLGALDLRVEALEANEQIRRSLVTALRPGPESPQAEEALVAEMAAALGRGLGDRVRPFVEHFRSAGEVLVLGCGSGEAFEALDGAAAGATGVEASATLVAECRSRGYIVELAELRSYLECLPERSLGGLVLTRVVDRHPPVVWPRLVAAAWRSLRPGGVALFEGLTGGVAATRLRWLLARQRFAIVDAREFSAGAPGSEEHVIVGRRSETA